MHLVVVERHPQRAAFAEQLAQQDEPRPHHAQPLVVAQHVVAVDRVGAQPLLHDRRVDAVAVAPAFVAGVVRRVDEDQVDGAGIARQQALERMQVVAVDHQVAGQIGRADALAGVRDQRPVGHRQVVVVDVFLALEDDFRHCTALRVARDCRRSGALARSGPACGPAARRARRALAGLRAGCARPGRETARRCRPRAAPRSARRARPRAVCRPCAPPGRSRTSRLPPSASRPA